MNYYYLNIEFPNIDFTPFEIDCEICPNIFSAYLYADGNEILLKIFYDQRNYFGEKLSSWSSKIDWKKFGLYLQTSDEKKNRGLKKIDFSQSQLLGMSNGSNQFEGESKFVSIRLDSVKLYWEPVKEKFNTSEFYFDEAGFQVVKDFYSTLHGWDGQFKIVRMEGMDAFYPIGKAEFRPEFDFGWSDDFDNNQAIITKAPTLQFRYLKTTSEEEAILYGDIIRYLASFYYHTPIGFSMVRIHLPEHTIAIKKVFNKRYFESSGNLWGFNNFWDFNQFLQSNWQLSFFENYEKLSKVISLFNQSLLVDSYSEFLIRYNIIEICNDLKQTNDKFTEVLTGKAKQKKYKDALNLLLKTISKEEQKGFINNWNTLSGKLAKKPAMSPLLKFFENQNLNPLDFPISVNNLKKLRDYITHGSMDKVDVEFLERANTFLYRITGILILNLLGIQEWELKKEHI